MSEIARRFAVVDAPSNLGLRPPEDGIVPGCYKAPGVLRDAGLLDRLGARDGGVVTPGRYRPGRADGEVRNEAAIADHSLRLAERLEPIIANRDIAVVLGGDCSILVGVGLALHRNGRYGLVSLDGLDYRHPGNCDAVGSAGGESLALATGLGGTLANLDGRRPYLRSSDVVSIGSRPGDEFADEAAADGVMVIDAATVARGTENAAREAMRAIERSDLTGFWVHMDVDVIDPDLMPAVDSPEPGGLTFDQLAVILGRLTASPRFVGLDLTIYDPDLDPDLTHGREITDLLVKALAGTA
ncbi:arginase family protein [Marinitenerispora sediminis]|uniref:Arginase n=1 Tax=Marinitenerispora sediminis TaxID=1931232 RepID=A0A368T324_9ACTN|nr:arginase family protein [Marinitenerispora sediminis]RCV49367.1 arginase [Marinitenerispora sediminis]RCV55986.1 arginase [Marinitenerispora sediminis]RCV56601.1 arginase [Marinitenerispora sediminis]